jgi:uncharacterized protein (TIGR02147 family)
MKPNIYEYDDFKLFLKDAFDAQKADDLTFSYRKFAALAGFKNPGYLNDVIKSYKPLSENASFQMAKAFKLTQKEAEYLWLLTQFGQTDSDTERALILQQIVFRRNRSTFARVNPSLAKYYSDHRYSLVRAAIEVIDFRGNYEKLSTFFDPAIPTHEVKNYLRDLCEWGLVEQKSNGSYCLTNTFVEPSPPLSGQIRQINREWISQAMNVQQKFKPSERHVSTILLSVSDDTEMKVREAIEKFREEIFRIIKSETKPLDKLMQLNVQFFPQSKHRNKL